MTDLKATDLPQGSVVADNNAANFRLLDGAGLVWRGTDGKRRQDTDVQRLLDGGAQVLRVGT